MKNNKILKILTTISLAFVLFLIPCLISANKVTETIRTTKIEVTRQTIDYQSILDEFEEPVFEIKGSKSSFSGIKTFNLSDFCELDLVSDSDLVENNEIKIKYNYEYDHELNLVLLSAKLVDDNDIEIIDTMIGVPFVDENGNLDCVFDCDGEYILLSELQSAGMIENCGWFKNICKKVTQVATKVVKETVSFVYDHADVIVPLAIGIVGGITGGAALPILIAGAATGAIIDGTKTAIQSYQETGKVDWVATGVSAGIGAAVGAVATYTGYSIGSALRPETDTTNSSNVDNDCSNQVSGTSKVANGTGYKSFDSFKNANGIAGENQTWHRIVEQNSSNIEKFGAETIHNTGNLVKIPSGFSGSLHSKITGYYNSFQPAITGSENMTIRNWLSSQSFDAQYQFGIDVLLRFAKELNIEVTLP